MARLRGSRPPRNRILGLGPSSRQPSSILAPVGRRTFSASASKPMLAAQGSGMNDKVDRSAGEAAREGGDTEAAHLWASIGHEIRTPLMGVVGMLELLGRTALSETQR